MSERDTTASDTRHQGGEMLAAVSDRLVRLIRDSTGRGPTQCKTYWAGNDIVLVELRGGFSVAEHTMVDAGHSSEVHASRRALQDSVEGQMREIVSSEVGRPVQAFMSTSHIDPDLMVEIFVLEPGGA